MNAEKHQEASRKRKHAVVESVRKDNHKRLKKEERGNKQRSHARPKGHDRGNGDAKNSREASYEHLTDPSYIPIRNALHSSSTNADVGMKVRESYKKKRKDKNDSSEQLPSTGERTSTQDVSESRSEKRRRAKEKHRTIKVQKEPTELATTRSNLPEGTNQDREISLVSESISNSLDVSWTLALAQGGRFLDQPIEFLANEKQMLFATELVVSVASVESSVIERSLRNPASGTITSTTRSRQHRCAAYIGTSNGDLIFWSWKKGKQKIQLISTSYKLTTISAITAAEISSQAPELIFTAGKSSNAWFIHVHTNIESSQERIDLLETDQAIQSLKVHESGRLLVATTSTCLLIGSLNSSLNVSRLAQSVKDLSYTWQEIQCKEPPTCFDFRFIEDVAERYSDEGVVPATTVEVRLDVAYGGLKGSIYLHTNVLRKLRKRQTNLLPQQLHWHREPVGALAFSPDGNYLISGGQETVLIMWQLGTGNKSFLPHLESPVRTLSIPASGSLYGVGLADNSFMVLSTAEVKPIAHIAGLQSPSTPSVIDHRLLLPTKETISTYLNGQAPTTLPCVVASSNPAHILLAAPSYRSFNNTVFGNTPPSPHLQTFNSFSNVHISRQALTRNNATSTNLGPEGNRIYEPNVTHLAVSGNGLWMATVDEWAPPLEDASDLAVDSSEVSDEVSKQHEVSLRIWHWDDNGKDWMLNTALPSPHDIRYSRLGPARVLALISHPIQSSFVTVGEDGSVRLWGPRTRRPDGKYVKGEGLESHGKAAKRAETWWVLRQSTSLEGRMQDEPLSALMPNSAEASWSEDGSLVAVSLGFPAPILIPSRAIAVNEDTTEPEIDLSVTPRAQNTVHLIDLDAAKICDNLNHLTNPIQSSEPTTIHGLAFANRHLVVLSRTHVHVWDLPLSTLISTTSLSSSTPDSPPPHLAINAPTNTFAVAIPTRQESRQEDEQALPPHPHRDFTSHISIFSLPSTSQRELHCLMQQPLPRLALALLSAAGDAAHNENSAESLDPSSALRKGYLVIDCGASIQRIRPPLVGGVMAAALGREQRAEIDGEVGNDSEDEDEEAEKSGILAGALTTSRSSIDVNGGGDRTGDVPGQPRVVPSQKLAEAIGDEGAGLPSVRAMFDRVVGLFWGRAGDSDDN